MVSNKAIHIALGVMADGTKVVTGLWIEQNEGAKFLLRVMNELENRSVEDIMLHVVDGLKGFQDAITAVFPAAVLTLLPCEIVRSMWTKLIAWWEARTRGQSCSCECWRWICDLGWRHCTGLALA